MQMLIPIIACYVRHKMLRPSHKHITNFFNNSSMVKIYAIIISLYLGDSLLLLQRYKRYNHYLEGAVRQNALFCHGNIKASTDTIDQNLIFFRLEFFCVGLQFKFT